VCGCSGPGRIAGAAVGVGHLSRTVVDDPFPKKSPLAVAERDGEEKSTESAKISPNIIKTQKKFDWPSTDLQRLGWLSSGLQTSATQLPPVSRLIVR
jgi:hypothetical protein